MPEQQEQGGATQGPREVWIAHNPYLFERVRVIETGPREVAPSVACGCGCGCFCGCYCYA